MEFIRKKLRRQSYVYVDREVPYGPEIAQAMGSAFGEVFGFVHGNGIKPKSMPMSVYIAMPDGPNLHFRGGVIVTAKDAAKATGNIKADKLPGGEVMHVVHTGPYENLHLSHQALWKHMEDEGIPAAMPVWEIYVDDPEKTAPDALRTEIYRAIGQ